MNIDFEFEVHRDFASNCRRPVNRVAKSMPQTRLDLPLSVPYSSISDFIFIAQFLCVRTAFSGDMLKYF